MMIANNLKKKKKKKKKKLTSVLGQVQTSYNQYIPVVLIYDGPR
jgi:hypothetical protein